MQGGQATHHQEVGRRAEQLLDLLGFLVQHSHPVEQALYSVGQPLARDLCCCQGGLSQLHC